MKHELREGAFVIKPKSTYHLMRTIYENSLGDTNMILLENKVEENYDEDNYFVQNLRSRSLNHNNIILTIDDRGCKRLRIFKTLHFKSGDKYREYKCSDVTALSLEEKSSISRRGSR